MASPDPSWSLTSLVLRNFGREGSLDARCTSALSVAVSSFLLLDPTPVPAVVVVCVFFDTCCYVLLSSCVCAEDLFCSNEL
ncbi:hypothetical protein NPIL_112741 [Nephila pilipes]|uniref:Uncharacterized protein n=1 Tax=Nephila pilipes TaxID=299642 RepID=A0A8X6TBA6_NEPPI|nr:hypothetical protein NPIL_112741 [Nephila pilipes]